MYLWRVYSGALFCVMESKQCLSWYFQIEHVLRPTRCWFSPSLFSNFSCLLMDLENIQSEPLSPLWCKGETKRCSNLGRDVEYQCKKLEVHLNLHVFSCTFPRSNNVNFSGISRYLKLYKCTSVKGAKGSNQHIQSWVQTDLSALCETSGPTSVP